MTATTVELPPIIAFPPAPVRKSIPEKEWHGCIQLWISLSHAYLSLPIELFDTAMAQGSSLPRFLTSYMEGMAKPETDQNYMQINAATDLHRIVFLIVHRLFFESHKTATAMADWRFLADLSRVYKRSNNLTTLLEKAWSDHEQTFIDSLNHGYKGDLLSRLENGDSSAIAHDEIFSSCLLPLLRACPSLGTYLLTGSDFSDAIISAYVNASLESRPKLLLLTYLCLLAPLQTEKPNQSLLFDHLYSLKSIAQSSRNPLLPDLISNTPFTSKFRRLLKNHNDSRSLSLITSLEQFRTAQTLRSKKPSRRKIKNGKSRSTGIDLQTTTNGIQVHRMSLVTQIQDLFPYLGSGFVVKLLDEYADDIEIVTAHLLEDDLPSHLRSLDQSDELLARRFVSADGSHGSRNPDGELAPRTTPPPLHSPEHPTTASASTTALPIRHNIHDNDDFDNLRVPASQLHFGRREDTTTPLTHQDASSRAASKAAILAALSAFDADDDERDDTYDLADVGGTVDTATGPAADDKDKDKEATALRMPDDVEAALFAAFTTDQEVFGRNAATRRGAPRAALRERTGLSDEAVEGWAVMVRRDPRRLRRLEARFVLGAGGAGGGAAQSRLAKTAWRASGAATTDEEADGASSSGGEATRGGARGRGSGRGNAGVRSGGQGSVAGAPGDTGTQRSRQRKEAGKGSRANHNRRDQRARKMARGGFPG